MASVSVSSVFFALVFLLCLNTGSRCQAQGGADKIVVTTTLFKGNLLFAGTVDKGVYLSADSGRTFKLSNTGMLDRYCYVNSLFASGDNVFAEGCGGLFVSTNDGKSWTKVIAGSTGNGDIFVSTPVSFRGKLFAGTRGQGLKQSSDNGLTWTQVPEISKGDIRFLAATGNVMVAMDDENPGNHIYYSSLDGIAWTTVKGYGKYPMNADDIVAFDGEVYGRKCVYDYNKGEYSDCRGREIMVLSKDGKKWEEIKQTSRYFAFNKGSIYAITVIKGSIKENFSYTRTILKSEDRGRKWKPVDEATEPFVVSDPGMQEKLRELDEWKEEEILEAKVAYNGYLINKEQADARRREIKQSQSNSGYKFYNGSTTSDAPNYKQLSDDRFKERNNKRDTWIDSQGKLHTN
jgi:photosystem II stability/assembly factor-like uncharacterized protein